MNKSGSNLLLVAVSGFLDADRLQDEVAEGVLVGGRVSEQVLESTLVLLVRNLLAVRLNKVVDACLLIDGSLEAQPYDLLPILQFLLLNVIVDHASLHERHIYNLERECEQRDDERQRRCQA